MIVPSMSRRHFKFIAETIRDTARDLAMSDQDIERIARHFARSLRSTNVNFDKDKFIEACKPRPVTQ